MLLLETYWATLTSGLMQKGISDDNWDTPYGQAVRSEMKGQAVNSTINRARRAKQLQGLLKHSICLGLGYRTEISVRLQLGRCLWALNENLGFCWALLQHQTLNCSQRWSPPSKHLCVAGAPFMLQGFWAEQASLCLQWGVVSWDSWTATSSITARDFPLWECCSAQQY